MCMAEHTLSILQVRRPFSCYEAKPAQPKDAQDRSGAKDLVASSGEQPSNGATATATPKVDASAPVTNSQVAPVSTPPSSEKPPIVPSDSTPAPATFDPENEKGSRDSTVPTITPTPAVTTVPTPRVPDALERQRKKRLLVVHTRLAKFFTWILLLGFVLLPSTLTRPPGNNSNATATSTSTPTPTPTSGVESDAGKIRDAALNHIRNYSLFAIGYTCCLINGIAISWLWRLRKDDPEWLFTNLFAAGLINAFSGLITTLVSFFGVEGGQVGSSTKSTLVLASACTFVYGVLTIIYSRKRKQARYRRGSRASSAMA